MSGYRTVLAFDRDEPEFAAGFECGRVWAQLEENEHVPVVETMRASNAEMVLRIAESRDRVARSVELCDGWIQVTFLPLGDDGEER